MKVRKVAATASGKVELIEREMYDVPLAADELEGKALASVISPGTETAGILGQWVGANFPLGLGYAAVFKVENCGDAVKGFKPGDLAFCMNNHSSYHRAKEENCVKVPEGLDPAVAGFARLMGISMATLNTTTARPPSKVVITGLGIVGNLAAQVFQRCGFEVFAVEPNENRRKFGEACGIKNLLPAIPVDDPAMKGKIQLVLDCSGHEKAVLDALSVAAKRGEVVLLGVPWAKKTDLYAYDILKAVFFNYPVLRSGWEWEVPVTPRDFKGSNMQDNFAGAMNWLKEESVIVDGLYDVALPKEAAKVYETYMQGKPKYLTTVFNWKDE